MEKMKPWDIIKLLEKTPGRNDKIEILKSQSSNHEFKFGLIACYDPYITYGVKQIPEKTELTPLPLPVAKPVLKGGKYSTGNDDLHDQVSMRLAKHVAWTEFDSILLKLLRSRAITGNAAKELIIDFMNNCETLDEWNYWYKRILQKDMKCGITSKSINTAYGNLIKTFGVHLASEGHGKEHLMTDSLIEYKYDGVRCIAIVKDNDVKYYTRNGKEINKQKLPDEVHEILNIPELQGLVFDGELMSTSFQELMQLIHKKIAQEVKDVYYAVFDVLPYEEFVKGESTKTLIERKNQLSEITREHPDFFWANQLQIVEHNEWNLAKEHGQGQVDQTLTYYLDQALEFKFEGLIVKDRNSLWKAGRDNSWLKIKPFIERSLPVIEIEEGTGKNKGRLGNLICEGLDTGQLINVNVGSGFTDEQRQEIWDNKNSYIGMIAEVRADAVSEALNGKYSLRFPRFKAWRGTKPGEKV